MALASSNRASRAALTELWNEAEAFSEAEGPLQATIDDIITAARAMAPARIDRLDIRIELP
ncbi:hypothetical protein [Propionibacterium freudenreichii]|uniref:hypothetical protein n=1 Tax=Propionibacterium freudenreichii TaxID=1744 RepID=UPI0007AC4655|nr:hypothetical protein [Propionibacterium freudenreichii]CUW13374.1 putative protein without homology [Propionibacterium freudenreichii subsp. shermanii]